MDIRFIQENPNEEQYYGRISTPNELYIKVPAWPYSLLNEEHYRDDLDKQLRKKVDRGAMDAIDNKRHAAKDKAGGLNKWKHYVLEFPDDHELSSKVLYEEAGEFDELPLARVNVPEDSLTVGTRGNSLTGKHCYAVWKVARVDVKEKKKGRYDSNAAKTKNAALLDDDDEGMDTEDANE